MLPGTDRHIVLPQVYVPPPPGCIDVCLATHFMEKFGNLSRLPTNQIRSLNHHLQELNILDIWNSCNGLSVDRLSELSLDATPRNHHFVNTPRPPARLRRSSVQKYFEEKYNILLNYPHSPLLRDLGGRMFPLEAIYIRIRLF